MLTGLIRSQNAAYYADNSGRLQTGWRYITDSWYYFDQASFAMRTGILTESGKTYFLRDNGTMAIGWTLDRKTGCWRYANKKGQLLSGWLKIDNAWYYIEPQSYKMLTGLVDISGTPYYLTSSGRMGTGWIKDTQSQGWLYADTSGALRKGWIFIANNWYYINSDYLMHTGILEQGASRYLLLENGKMAVGWGLNKKDYSWYYANSSGILQSGWLHDDEWYYLSPSTRAMAKDSWVNDGTGWYNLKSNGAMRHNAWLKDHDGWHYFNTSGRAVTDWHKFNSGIFYFDPFDSDRHFPALVGHHIVNDSDYYFDEHNGLRTNCWIEMPDESYGYADATGIIGQERIRNGILWLTDTQRASGVVTIGAKKFYANPDTGVLSSGWKTFEGKQYYFSPENMTLQYGWIYDNGWYYLNRQSGAMMTGWVKDGSWYYLAPSGLMKTGWQLIESKWYYLNTSNGAMQTGVIKDQGVYYLLANDGHWIDVPIKWGDMLKRAQRYSSRTSWLLLVDTAGCRTVVYKRISGVWSPYREWKCSPGAKETPTPKGEYTVYGKGYSFGRGYTCYYYTQFYGDYLFHSVLYQQGTFNILDGRIGMNLSHGCIRLPLDQAKWIYDNIPYGTKVAIY